MIEQIFSKEEETPPCYNLRKQYEHIMIPFAI